MAKGFSKLFGGIADAAGTLHNAKIQREQLDIQQSQLKEQKRNNEFNRFEKVDKPRYQQVYGDISAALSNGNTKLADTIREGNREFLDAYEAKVREFGAVAPILNYDVMKAQGKDALDNTRLMFRYYNKPDSLSATERETAYTYTLNMSKDRQEALKQAATINQQLEQTAAQRQTREESIKADEDIEKMTGGAARTVKSAVTANTLGAEIAPSKDLSKGGTLQSGQGSAGISMKDLKDLDDITNFSETEATEITERTDYTNSISLMLDFVNENPELSKKFIGKSRGAYAKALLTNQTVQTMAQFFGLNSTKNLSGAELAFLQQNEKMFNAYRKAITGAQASVKELALLQKAIPSLLQNPATYKQGLRAMQLVAKAAQASKYAQIIQRRQPEVRGRAAELINTKDPEILQMMEQINKNGRIDSSWFDFTDIEQSTGTSTNTTIGDTDFSDILVD